MMLPDGKIYEATLNIGKAKDDRKILYDINKIRQVGVTTFSAKQSGRNSFLTDNANISQQSENVKYSFPVSRKYKDALKEKFHDYIFKINFK